MSSKISYPSSAASSGVVSVSELRAQHPDLYGPKAYRGRPGLVWEKLWSTTSGDIGNGVPVPTHPPTRGVDRNALWSTSYYNPFNYDYGRHVPKIQTYTDCPVVNILQTRSGQLQPSATSTRTTILSPVKAPTLAMPPQVGNQGYYTRNLPSRHMLTRLPPIVSNSYNRKLVTEPQCNNGSRSPERRSIFPTSGYAKRYMIQSHGRLFQNLNSLN